MGRYEFSDSKRAAARKKEPHPIWQGIGCLIIIILPVISYVLADLTIKMGLKAHWSFLPYELLGTALS
jgi:hypothetical protein